MAFDRDSLQLQSLDKPEVVKPYLKKFLENMSQKNIQDIVEWNATEEEYAKFDAFILNFNLEEIKKLLLGGAPYLYKAYDTNPIQLAANFCRTDIMEIILERDKNENEDVFEFMEQTQNALFITCLTNCRDIARLLLEIDTPIVPKEHLVNAADRGSTAVLSEILRFLPDIEIDPNDEDGNTPLNKAIENKHKYTVKLLLDHKADPSIANKLGYNSLHMACQYADADILHLLTTRGGDVNARENKGKTPALIAAENGKEGCIRVLAEAGADLDQRDNEGNAPLTIAASEGYPNTIKELILNEATFGLQDFERNTAIERAIMNKRDAAAAMIIRLAPYDNYVQHLVWEDETSLFKIARYRLMDTLNAVLDKMVIQDDPLDATRGIVHTEYLDVDTDKHTPGDDEYQKNKTFFLQRVAGLDNEQLAYHGTVRLLVDEKMKQFGNRILGVKIFFFTVFLLSLAYSLIAAANRPIELSSYTSDAVGIIRIFTDLIVFAYFIFNLLTECVEFFRVMRLTSRYIQDKKKYRHKEQERKALIEEEIKKDSGSEEDEKDGYKLIEQEKKEPPKRALTSRLNDIFCIRIFTDYFGDKFNYLDVLGLLTLFILIILRVTTQPIQWVFATLTFLINGLRVFKLVALLPRLGPYTNIIYKILINDVPLFSTLFALTLLIFTGGFYVSLKTPYTGPGIVNASLNQDTDRINGVDNEVQWVFLSGLRVLLEGNVYEGQYLYRQLNWLAAPLYLSFLFLITVVYQNVFIAQLSDTYDTFKNNAELTFAWQRLNFIVQIERTSLMSTCIDYRKKYFIKQISLSNEGLVKYYGVHNIKSLNTSISSIGPPSQTPPPPPPPPPPSQKEESQQIQVLERKLKEMWEMFDRDMKEKCEMYEEEIMHLRRLLDDTMKQKFEETIEKETTPEGERKEQETMFAEQLEKSNQALLGMIVEKLKELK